MVFQSRDISLLLGVTLTEGNPYPASHANNTG